MNVILCSPRRILLENKEDQHKGEVFYAKNDLENPVDFEKDLSKVKVKLGLLSQEKLLSEEEETSVEKLRGSIRTWVESCKRRNIPCKILVTYDSFRHVKEVLGDEISNFYTVVDEFQSIFIDSRFKSTSEIEFLDNLKGLKKVCFVSATPMMEKYLDMLEEFKDLPFFELDWSSENRNRIIKPNLEVIFTRKLAFEADRVIQSYLSGDYEESSSINESTGEIKTVISNEAVLYFNSVKSICDIIKRNELTLDQVNVLCADTKSNRDKVSKALGCDKSQAIGKIPKLGENHKMFTLCTRTVYLGSDFYSTNARSFIFSDSRIDCLSVDISMDLNQILGRQRLDENPWKNSAELIVKLDGKKWKEEDFKRYVSEKDQNTNKLLEAYFSLTPDLKHVVAEKYQRDVIQSAYKSDYVSVNTHGGRDIYPVYNNLVKNSELRTFEIQQKDYADRFSLMNTLEENGLESREFELNSFLFEFENLSTFVDKMRFLCIHPENSPEINKILNLVPEEYKNYYLVVGREKIISWAYNITRIKKEYENLKKIYSGESNLIRSEFKVGERLSIKEIKDRLKALYNREGITKTSKATDLKSEFALKRIRLRDENNNRIEGFELLPLSEDL